VTVTAEAGFRYDFWLQWVWSELKLILLSLAAVEVAVLSLVRRRASHRVGAVVAGAAAVAGDWVLTATGFYVAVRLTPSGTHGTGWMGLAIVVVAAAVAFLGTAAAHLKLTSGGSRSNPRLDPPAGPRRPDSHKTRLRFWPAAGQPDRYTS